MLPSQVEGTGLGEDDVGEGGLEGQPGDPCLLSTSLVARLYISQFGSLDPYRTPLFCSRDKEIKVQRIAILLILITTAFHHL